MFRRPHHQRIAEALSVLDADLLAQHNCWFGGGTAIVLDNNEYRESVDIDFLVSDYRSYRALRQLVRDKGVGGLARTELQTPRSPIVDGYGIRSSLLVADVQIKFEIIHEGRIELDVPSPDQVICGVRTLTRTDQVASKLLANDDRWADTSTFNRDLIDLAMMRAGAAELEAGAAKAFGAYDKTVGESFAKAVTNLRERPQRLDECVRALKIDQPRAVVWQEIRKLAKRCAQIELLNRHGDHVGRSRPHIPPPAVAEARGDDRPRGKTTPSSNHGSFTSRRLGEAEGVHLVEPPVDPER